MNVTLVPVFYAAVAVATLWLALLVCARLKPNRRTRVLKVLIGVVTIALLRCDGGEEVDRFSSTDPALLEFVQRGTGRLSD